MSSVTLMLPAKAVVRNEMPFSSDTHVVPSNAGLHEKGRFGDRNPPVCSDAAYRQITLAFLTVVVVVVK